MPKRTLFGWFGLPERAAKLPKNQATEGSLTSSEPELTSGVSSEHSAEWDGHGSASSSSVTDLLAGSSTTSSIPEPEPWRRPFRIRAEPKYAFRKFANPDDIYKYIPRDDPYWTEDSCHHEDCFCKYCVIIFDKDADKDLFWDETSSSEWIMVD